MTASRSSFSRGSSLTVERRLALMNLGPETLRPFALGVVLCQGLVVVPSCARKSDVDVRAGKQTK